MDTYERLVQARKDLEKHILWNKNTEGSNFDASKIACHAWMHEYRTVLMDALRIAIDDAAKREPMSPEDYRRWRMCGRKKGYDSEYAARHAVRNIAAERVQMVCSYCGKWHNVKVFNEEKTDA